MGIYYWSPAVSPAPFSLTSKYPVDAGDNGVFQLTRNSGRARVSDVITGLLVFVLNKLGKNKYQQKN